MSLTLTIMEGIQWPPLMVDLSLRKSKRCLKITAIVADRRGSSAIFQTQEEGSKNLLIL